MQRVNLPIVCIHPLRRNLEYGCVNRILSQSLASAFTRSAVVCILKRCAVTRRHHRPDGWMVARVFNESCCKRAFILQHRWCNLHWNAPFKMAISIRPLHSSCMSSHAGMEAMIPIRCMHAVQSIVRLEKDWNTPGGFAQIDIYVMWMPNEGKRNRSRPMWTTTSDVLISHQFKYYVFVCASASWFTAAQIHLPGCATRTSPI